MTDGPDEASGSRKQGDRQRTVLDEAGWVDWTCQRFGLDRDLVQIQLPGKHSASLESTLYRNKAGRVVSPPMHPHLDIHVEIAPTAPADSAERLRLELGRQLAKRLQQSGLRGSLILPPDYTDARSFQWAGLQVGLSYTHQFDFPRVPRSEDRDITRRAAKAANSGYYVERSSDWPSILDCLNDTAKHAGFRQRLTLSDLFALAKGTGPEFLRGYLVRDSAGVPVSGGIVLFREGCIAINWQQGSMRTALSAGVSQLMYTFALADVERDGASGFNFAGADIPSVAAAKAAWRAPLRAQLRISQVSVSGLLRSRLAHNERVMRIASKVRN